MTLHETAEHETVQALSMRWDDLRHFTAEFEVSCRSEPLRRSHRFLANKHTGVTFTLSTPATRSAYFIFNRQGACNRLQSSELVQELRTVILDAAEKTRAAYDVLSSSNRTRTTQYHTLSHRADLQKPNTGCFGLRGPDTRVPDRAFRTELAPQPYDAAGRARGAAL